MSVYFQGVGSCDALFSDAYFVRRSFSSAEKEHTCSIPTDTDRWELMQHMVRLQVKNLEDVVLQFTLGRGDVLLATSIIENGIDMPNVNSIVVMVSVSQFGLVLFGFVPYSCCPFGYLLRRSRARSFSILCCHDCPRSCIRGYTCMSVPMVEAWLWWVVVADVSAFMTFVVFAQGCRVIRRQLMSGFSRNLP